MAAAVQQHIQHGVLIRRSVGLCGEPFPEGASHSLHHEPVYAPQPLHVKAALHGEHRHVLRQRIGLSHIVQLGAGRAHTDADHRPHAVAFFGLAEALYAAGHQPAQIENLAVCREALARFLQRVGGQTGLLREQPGILGGIARARGVNDRIHVGDSPFCRMGCRRIVLHCSGATFRASER